MQQLSISPLKDAVAVNAGKTPVGAVLTSAEWDAVPAEIKLRSMFAARVETERVLAEMQSKLGERLEMARRDGRTMDRGRFMEEMRALLREEGYKRPEGVKRGSLRDLRGHRRLGLIFDMNVAQAEGYAKWKAGMDEDVLLAVPCQELIRVKQRAEIRDWPLVWEQNGGEFFGEPGPDYPLAKGRMIAAKDDQIWERISRFGTPWPPFDWGSGMGLKNIRRKEAVALGVIDQADRVRVLQTPFNDQTRASLKGVPQESRQRIAEALQGDVEIIGDEIRILPPPSDLPARPVFPVAVQTAFFTAAEELAAWPESRLQTLLSLLEKTVAWQRFRSSLRAAGGTPQDHDALVRALTHFQASPELRAAVREIRNGPLRDAFWSPADFRKVEEFLTKGGAP